MNLSFSGLALSYAVHMVATVLWLGGLATLALWVLPEARKLDRGAYAGLLSRMQRRLDGIGWFSLVVLTLTGLFQMSASSYYEGFLTIQNTWSAAILVKHVLFGLMIVVSAYLTWGVLPRLQRLALMQSQGVEPPAGSGSFDALVTTNTRLLYINLVLALLVLVLTAVARAA